VLQLDAGRDRDADAILIVGSQIRDEAPLLNVRLRKAAKRRQVFIIGPAVGNDLPRRIPGHGRRDLNLPPASDALASAKRPAIIVGGAGLAKGALEPALAISNRFFVRTLKTARNGTASTSFTCGGKPYGRPDAGLRAEGRHRRSGCGGSCW
jgi:CO dehydrogenase/acetyl-CoA synthase epsilon subunit